MVGCNRRQDCNSACPTASKAGPTNIPRKPKAISPPKTPRMISVIGMATLRLISSGLTTLSLPETNTMPHSNMKTAQPSVPLV